jgi:hypothetical protein
MADLKCASRYLVTAGYLEFYESPDKLSSSEILCDKEFKEWKELYGWFNPIIKNVFQWSIISDKCKCYEQSLGMTTCLLFPVGTEGTYAHFFHRGFD